MVALSVFILGFFSLVAQIVMTRELMVSFYGNEFFIGWILFAWLFWVAVGSVSVKFVTKDWRSSPLVLIACHLLSAFFVPFNIWAIRASRGIFAGIAGEIPDLFLAMGVSFFVLAPLCVILGMQFVVSSVYGQQCLNGQNNKAGASFYLGKAYFYETLGSVMGGLVFSCGLVFLMNFRLALVFQRELFTLSFIA